MQAETFRHHLYKTRYFETLLALLKIETARELCEKNQNCKLKSNY